MRTLAERLAEQEKRHQGGSKMIGTAGTSPFGAYGYNPRACGSARTRAGTGARSRSGTSAQFRNLADDVEVGTRNLKVALRKLRRFARAGAAEELDLDEPRSAAPPEMPGCSTCSCGRSGTMRSRC